MGIRHWFRPARHVFAIFVAVGIVSAAALAWLMGSLLEADSRAQKQRQQERLEQTADRAVAAMQSALSDLELQLGTPLESIDSLPADVIAVRVGHDGIVAQPGQGLLYYAKPIRGVEAPADFFETGEQMEWGDPRAAAESYARLVQDSDNAVRAGALMRLARVRRRLHDPAAARRAYDELAKATGTSVAALPAELLARVGRASVYEETHQAAQLQMEAAALDRDLRHGKWQLTIDEYAYYSSLTREWLNAFETADDTGRVALAGAVAWLWENRIDVTSRRLIDIDGNPLLIVPRATPDGFTGAIAGAGYRASLCNRAIQNARAQCTLSDDDRV